MKITKMYNKFIFNKYFLIGFFIIAIFLNFFFGNFVLKNSLVSLTFPNDIFFRFIDNEYPWAMVLAEIIIFLQAIIFCIFYFKERKDYKKWILIISAFYFLRGLLIPITILSPLESNSLINYFSLINYGLFPSGHAGFSFILLLFSFDRDKKIKYFFLISFLIVCFLILLGKQHYSIDIVGAVFIVYSIKSFVEKHIC